MGSGGLKSVWLNMGLFIRLNATNGPHCLEKFDFLPFCVRVMCPSSSPPRGPAAASVAPYHQRSGCAEMRSWVLPVIKWRDEGSIGEEGGISRYCLTRARTQLSHAQACTVCHYPSDGARRGGGFIRSKFQHYCAVKASGQAELLYLFD